MLKTLFSRNGKKAKEGEENGNKLTIDDDVFEEKKKIEKIVSDNRNKSPLLVHNLVKKYGGFTAVNDISYNINKGECFGLLGINGAGKTTTFKMITGDETITSGDIFVNGKSIKRDINSVLQEIGYCPQFDAILEDLTGAETLRMYSRLRGIQEQDIDGQIDELSKLMYFEAHIDKLVKDYSGGNKRKLSSAVVCFSTEFMIIN